MKTLEQRETEFRKHVYEVGGTTYTEEMLNNFARKWTEPDRAPGARQKMRFERESTWETSRRLVTWAKNNYDKIQCYLTVPQTIAQKKHNFAKSIEPFLLIYGSEMLNKFYRYWTMLENRPGSTTLRWENQEFWEISAKLQQWKEGKSDVMVKQKVG